MKRSQLHSIYEEEETEAQKFKNYIKSDEIKTIIVNWYVFFVK